MRQERVGRQVLERSVQQGAGLRDVPVLAVRVCCSQPKVRAACRVSLTVRHPELVTPQWVLQCFENQPCLGFQSARFPLGAVTFLGQSFVDGQQRKCRARAELYALLERCKSAIDVASLEAQLSQITKQERLPLGRLRQLRAALQGPLAQLRV